jgi:hypothetical protein
MIIHRIFTNQAGNSVVELRQVPLFETKESSGRPISEKFTVQEMFFRETPEGHVQHFHNAPRRQLIFITSGILELETSEGTKVICQPGDLIFTEDFEGKGHITRSLKGVRGFVHVIVPDHFEVTKWPLVT